MTLTWQPTLFDETTPTADANAGATAAALADPPVVRTWLDATSWVDHASGWAHDRLFEVLLGGVEWAQRSRRMYDGRVLEPRLTSGWRDTPVPFPELEQMRVVLSKQYGVEFDSVGLNLYRDGRDSVAWHGDRIAREIAEPVVALVSLGERRAFLLRPKGGGCSTKFMLGRGDLLVTGGRCQRDWQHSVPKVASAGPRISIAFRHGSYDAPGRTTI